MAYNLILTIFYEITVEENFVFVDKETIENNLK